ncbi:MAG: hypothetical protein JW891_05790 [Candidatus Lokiarchaeota archaeon]|nr:hypothetical protein [Candidatus Lokiarchaeota archaeon]
MTIQDTEKCNYYMKYFKFDPILDKIPLQNGYRYEAWFTLDNDKIKDLINVEIGARINVVNNKSHNRIVFKKGNEEVEVTCVHTAIRTVSAQEALNLRNGGFDLLKEFVQTSEGKTLNLPPEEHFVALKSYVEGIAEVGLSKMLITSYYSADYTPRNLPFGFNSTMQSQIVACLTKIAPKAIKEIVEKMLYELANSGNPDWFMSRLELLNDLYYNKGGKDIYDLLFGTIKTFLEFDKILDSEEFRTMAAYSQKSNPEIFPILAKKGEKHCKWGLLQVIHHFSNKQIKKEVLEILVKDQDPYIFSQALLNLSKISKKEEFKAYELAYERYIQKLARFEEDIPFGVLKILAKNGDVWVKKLIIHNPRSSFHIISILANDSDIGVKFHAELRKINKDVHDNDIIQDQGKLIQFNGTLLLSIDALSLVRMERDLSKIICTQMQLDTNQLLQLIPKNRIAPIVQYSKGIVRSSEISPALNKYLGCIVQELNLKDQHSFEIAPNIISWLIHLEKSGCNLELPIKKGTHKKETISSYLQSQKRGRTSLYISFKRNGLKRFFSLSSRPLPKKKLKNVLEMFELHPYGNFLEFEQKSLNEKITGIRENGCVLDVSMGSGLVFDSKNNLLHNLYEASKTNLQGFLKCKLDTIVKLCNRKKRIKILDSWYDTNLIHKICASIQSITSNRTSDTLVFLITSNQLPLLIKNPTIPIIGIIAPMTKNSKIS